MTRFHTRRLSLLFGALALGSALLGQSALAGPLDAGPRGSAPALTCPPTVGGEVNTLCTPKPACGWKSCEVVDACTDRLRKCRIED